MRQPHAFDILKLLQDGFVLNVQIANEVKNAKLYFIEGYGEMPYAACENLIKTGCIVPDDLGIDDVPINYKLTQKGKMS